MAEDVSVDRPRFCIARSGSEGLEDFRQRHGTLEERLHRQLESVLHQ
jgi:hypothetical protein